MSNEVSDNRSRRFQKCQAASQFYQSKFKDIPALKSEDFLRSNYRLKTTSHEDDGHNTAPDNNSDSKRLFEKTLLVDVRTEAERSVSMIRNSVSLNDFEQRFEANSSGSHNNDIPVVITYCTIGYRSGLEARRLRDKYGLQDRIYSLDGIVPFTYALAAMQDRTGRFCGLVQPVEEAKTKERIEDATANAANAAPSVAQKDTTTPASPTDQVHTFGSMWNFADESFPSTTFSIPELLVRFLQVCMTVVIRTIQRLHFVLKSYFTASETPQSSTETAKQSSKPRSKTTIDEEEKEKVA